MQFYPLFTIFTKFFLAFAFFRRFFFQIGRAECALRTQHTRAAHALRVRESELSRKFAQATARLSGAICQFLPFRLIFVPIRSILAPTLSVLAPIRSIEARRPFPIVAFLRTFRKKQVRTTHCSRIALSSLFHAKGGSTAAKSAFQDVLRAFCAST